jgi:NADH dehydrogenase [ubiquinone] 1 alpha subcomplex assembly factor 5
MGESNVCINRRERMAVDTFLASACIYDAMYPLENRDSHETDIEATVQVIYGIGWAPDSSQPKPKERGSASHKIGDIVVNETRVSQGKHN